MIFLDLTQVSERGMSDVFVNADRIVMMRFTPDGTLLVLTGPANVVVTEDPRTIIKMIEEIVFENEQNRKGDED